MNVADMDTTEKLFIYAVYYLKYDCDLADNDILCSVREKYYLTKKKLRNKRIIYRENSIYKYSYNLSSKSPLKWKKLKDGILIESVKETSDGYELYSLNEEDYSIAKKIKFSDSHDFISCSYYHSQVESLFERISVIDNKALKLVISNGSSNTEETLHICDYIADYYKREAIFKLTGYPEVLAVTNKGKFYFCTRTVEKKISKYLTALKSGYGKNILTNDAVGKPIVLPAALQKNSCDKDVTIESNSDKNIRHSSEVPFKTNDRNNGDSTLKNGNRYKFSGSVMAKRADLNIISKGRTFYYYGEVVNSLRSGEGFTVTDKGKIAYNGCYKDNKKDGLGAYYFDDGNLCYFGNWKANKKNGFGLQSCLNKFYAVGNWTDNSPNGDIAFFDCDGDLNYYGKINRETDDTFSIDFDKKNGFLFVRKGNTDSGTLFDRHGRLVYRGDYVNSKKEGNGVLYNSDENVMYTGGFKNDVYHGKGKLLQRNGNTVEGDFVNGRLLGDVIERDPSGFIVYRGEWFNNNRNGKGCCFFKNGGRYEGMFRNGKPYGYLKGYNKHGQLVYNGEWRNNHFCGHGIYYVNGKKIYDGDFRDDNLNGNGRLYSLKTGACIYYGSFKDGLENGWGTSYKNKKPYYSGEWKDGLYNGIGAIFKDDEIILCGTFKDGKKEGRINLIENGLVSEEQIYHENSLVYTKKFNITNPKSVHLLYMGNVDKNMPNGFGCAFDKFGGVKQEGIFVDGRLAKPMKIKFGALKELPNAEYLKDTGYDVYRRSVNYVIDKKMPNGSIYTGMLDEKNRPIGFATALYCDHIYIGQFNNGVAEGKGILYQSNGKYIKGIFHADKVNGCTRIVFENGVEYFCCVHNPKEAEK